MTRRVPAARLCAAPASRQPAGPGAWRWSNVPVPEAHLGVGALGVALSILRPCRMTWQPARHLGWPLIAGGVALAAWATHAAGATALDQPDRLVTSGPYARSRNPMYVAWTAIFLGTALVIRAAWLLLLLPLLAALIDRETHREEQRLTDVFGSDFDTYKAKVRRYL